MKGRIIYSCLLFGLCFVGAFIRSEAQTITTGAVMPNSICVGTGGIVTVSFTTSGTFASNNTFSAQLSTANGTFPANPTVIGTSRTTPSISATISSLLTVGSAYRVRVVSSNTAVTGSVSTNALVVNRRPVKPVVTTLQQACLGDTPNPLTAPPLNDGGTSLQWYTVSTGGNGSTRVPQPPTSSTGTTSYYVSQINAQGCESERSTIDFKVSRVPNAPTVTAPAPFCQGTPAPQLSAVADAGNRILWWGTSADGGASNTTPSPVSNARSDTYYVSQTTPEGCNSPRKPISVTVVNSPAKPKVGTYAPTCASAAPNALSATADANNTLRWWGTSEQGGASTLTPSPVNNTQSATYHVSQATKEGCDSPREAISVRIKKIPGAPNAPDPAPFCLNRQSRQLVATATEPGATVNWYDGANQLLPSAPEPPVSATGVITYSVGQTLEGCVSTARKTVQVTVNRIPDAPSASKPDDLCEGAVAQPLSATGASLSWYDDNLTGGTASTSPSPVKTTGSYVGKLTNYYVTQTVGGCESERAAIPVRVKGTPDKPITTSLDFCQGAQSPTLTVALIANATPNWFGTDATGGTASGTAPILSNSTVGTTTYYVSQTLEGCTGPRASFSVRVKPLPGQPGVSSVAFCNNRGAGQLTASGERLKWYDNAESLLGNDAPTPPTNTVGERFYKVSQTNGDGCEGPKATLKVTIKPLPGQPSVANVNFCQSQADQPAQNVSALTANGQNLRWYNPDGNAFPTAPTPAIDRAGVQTYQVSQTVDECEGERATLQVAVRTVGAPVVAKPLVTYCINAKATPLEATVETGASARWLDPYNRLTNDAPTPSTLNTNVDPAGDRFFVYQIGSNGCYSPRSAIRVVVNTTPTLSLLAPVPNVNLGLRVPLKLTFTGSAPYSYSITGGYTGTSLTNDTTIAVLPRGNTTYQVTSVTNGCGIGLPGNPATAVVTVRIPTIETGVVTNATVCAGTSLTVPFTTTGQFNPGNVFRFELVSVLDTARKYDVSATVNTSPVTATLPLTIPGGQYSVRVKALNPEIGVTGTNSPTRLTVRSLPSATLSGSQAIYEGTPANLTIALGGDGPWTLAYADSLRSYSVVTTTNPYVTEVRPARTTTYRITTVTNSCGSGLLSGTATVSVLPLLGIEDNSLDPLVTVYPVPTSRMLLVELDLPLLRDPAELSLTNLQGQSVLQRTTRSRRTELDLSAQPNGLYILHIQVGDRYTVRKVIKL